MERAKAHRIVYREVIRICKHYGIKPPGIRTARIPENEEDTYGLYDEETHLLFVNTKKCLTIADLIDTAKHEAAHAVCWKKEKIPGGHGVEWQRLALEVGCVPRANSQQEL